MEGAERREFTDEEKDAIVAGYRASGESQAAYAASAGVSQGTLSRWARGDRRARRPRAELARREAGRAPELLLVVATAGREAHATCSRVVLPGGAEVVFDGLVPPSWVAELAKELRRC
jgi:transposase-like protein